MGPGARVLSWHRSCAIWFRPVLNHAAVDDGKGLDATDAGLKRGSVMEEVVFGTADLFEIDMLLGGFCISELGSSIDETLFRETVWVSSSGCC